VQSDHPNPTPFRRRRASKTLVYEEMARIDQRARKRLGRRATAHEMARALLRIGRFYDFLRRRRLGNVLVACGDLAAEREQELEEAILLVQLPRPTRLEAGATDCRGLLGAPTAILAE
jgi:hypothetical protein